MAGILDFFGTITQAGQKESEASVNLAHFQQPGGLLPSDQVAADLLNVTVEPDHDADDV